MIYRENGLVCYLFIVQRNRTFDWREQSVTLALPRPGNLIQMETVKFSRFASPERWKIIEFFKAKDNKFETILFLDVENGNAWVIFPYSSPREVIIST